MVGSGEEEIDGLARFSVEIREGFLYVWQGGELADRDDAQRLQSEVIEGMGAAQVRRVVFNNRATRSPGEALREMMWRFISDPEHFDRVAIVLTSPDRVTKANERADDAAVAIRAFDAVDAAEAWIRGD